MSLLTSTHRLARAIENHWHGLGFTAVKVEVTDEHTIRSNLVNGLPPNHYFRGRTGDIVERYA